MTIDKAIRYPVRKKYRAGGYDAGASGGTASGYGGGAFGGKKTGGNNNSGNYNSISSYTAGATREQLESIQQGKVDKQYAADKLAADKLAEDNLAINTRLTSLYGLGTGFDLSGYNTDATTTSLSDIDAAMADLNKRKKSVAERMKEGALNAFNNPIETATNLTLGGLSNAYKGLSLNPGFAGAKLLGNFFNTNYTQDEDGNISSSLTGALGLPDYTNLAGLASAKNLIGYDTMTEAEQEAAQQNILRDIVTFDDTQKGYSTDFSNVDRSLYNPGSDLEANAKAAALANRGQKRDSADGLSTENVGGDTGGGDTGGGDTGGDDSTTNNKTYTAEQERTMNYMSQMGYSRLYQEDYIDKGGALFNFEAYDDADFVS